MPPALAMSNNLNLYAMSIYRNRPFHWHVCDPEGYVHYSTDDFDEACVKADELAKSDLDIRKFWIDKCGHVPSNVHAPAKYEVISINAM